MIYKSCTSAFKFVWRQSEFAFLGAAAPVAASFIFISQLTRKENGKMKQRLKLLILFVVLAIVLSSMFSCKDDKNDDGNSGYTDGENTPDNNGTTSGGDNTNGNGGDNTSPGENTGGEVTDITVTFFANGGLFENSQLSITQSVKPGERLQVPSSPTRDGYTFTQWYKDSSLEEIWDFDNDTVVSQVSIYAGWEIVEQKVTFVLNYDNIDPVVQSTVNGLVTNVPQRHGYVFNGWWLSDGKNSDGEYILSQKWDSTELVTESGLVLYAEWVEAPTLDIQLPAPSVSFNNNVFSWGAITGAVRYDIRVYKSGTATEIMSTYDTGTSWTFPSDYDADYYTVKIRAIGDGLNTINSSYTSKSYAHNILGLTSQINIDIATSVLTWTMVKNATEYDLYVNDKLVETVANTSYDMSDYDAGTYSIKIVAIRSGYKSSTTATKIEKKRLKTPSANLYINIEGGTYLLEWNSVANADVYKLNFGGTEIEVSKASSYAFDNDSDFWKGTNNIEFSLVAFDKDADYLVSTVGEVLNINKYSAFTVEKNIAEAGTTSVTGLIYVNDEQISDKYLLKVDSVSTTSDSCVYADEGASLTITAQNNGGYDWLGWYKGEELITTDTSYTFENSEQILTYTAKFAISSEMEKFNFTTNQGSFTITGIKDKSVTEIVVPDYVVSISKGAFSECSNLNSITLPFVGATNDGTSNTHFGYIFGASSYSDNASYVPSSLKAVVITGGTRIGSSAFYGCTNIIQIENGVSYVDKWVVDCDTSVTSVTLRFDTVGISGSAFYGCSSLTSITIPDSVTSIGNDAFYKCSRLTSITIPDSVTSIGNYAFRDCSNLNAVYITDISKWCAIDFGDYDANPLEYAKNLYLNGELVSGDIVLEGITRIGNYALYNQTGITSITIPDSVTSIGSGAFYGCSKLTSVNFGENSKLTSIGVSAFRGCSSLNAVYITDISKWCAIDFYNYEANPLYYAKKLYLNRELVTELVIPEDVTNISDYAFYNCTSLISVTIPDSVTSIGNSAFSGCSRLTSITIPDSVTSIGNYAFFGCKSITSITIPDSVTSIGDRAFLWCSSLISVTIPDSVTSIGNAAFSWCSSLTSITIPDSVRRIGNSAFRGCSSLTSITFQGTKAEWNSITKGSNWDYDTGNYTVHCTDGRFTK